MVPEKTTTTTKSRDLWEELVCSVLGAGLSPDGERLPRLCQSSQPLCSSLRLLRVASTAQGRHQVLCES